MYAGNHRDSIASCFDPPVRQALMKQHGEKDDP